MQLKLCNGYIFSLICQSVYVILPGRQHLQFYLCSNKLDFSQLDNSSFKANWLTTIFQIASFAIHIFVNIKIKILKTKQQNSLDALSPSNQLKYGDIWWMDNRSMSDFLTIFLAVAASSLYLIISFVVNHNNPLEFNQVTIF